MATNLTIASTRSRSHSALLRLSPLPELAQPLPSLQQTDSCRIRRLACAGAESVNKAARRGVADTTAGLTRRQRQDILAAKVLGGPANTLEHCTTRNRQASDSYNGG